MPLTIRNLTITPLELKQVDRLAGDPVLTIGGAFGNLTHAISGLWGNETGGNENRTATPVCVIPRDDAPTSTEQITNMLVEPFATRETAIRPADPAKEVLRLTLEVPGTGQRYRLDVPGPSPRSLTMVREGGEGGAFGEFTAVYLGASSFLAIFSSAALNSWMRELPGSWPLSALSIPGTHNSPTCHKALPSVRCQAVGVREQLDNGVRFLDVRLSASDRDDDDDLALVHSAFPISLTGTKWFADLLAEVYGFLDANPSETVLMSVKREGTGKGTDQQLSCRLARRYTAGDAAHRWHTAPCIPKLDQVRGKVVLVRRFAIDDCLRDEHEGAGWGIDGSVWPDNCDDGTCGTGQIRIQDFYEVQQTTHVEKKVDYVLSHLERSAEQLHRLPDASGGTPSPLPVFVNFLSASNFFNASLWPENIATKINPRVIEYLCTRHGEPGKGPGQREVGHAATGVVVTDWVGHQGDWDLIRCIVGWNSRLQLQQ